MIDAKKAQALVQTHVGLGSSVTLLDGLPDGLYLTGVESNFYFEIGRPGIERVGGIEIAIVHRTSGAVTISHIGE